MKGPHISLVSAVNGLHEAATSGAKNCTSAGVGVGCAGLDVPAGCPTPSQQCESEV